MTNENSSKVVKANEANTTTSRFWARDNDGQIHWGTTQREAARKATEANIDLRQNH